MSWFGNLLPDKISEGFFRSFIILTLGFILSIAGAAEKIEINKISFVLQITDFYLKIIVTITGVSLISFGGYFLLRENSNNIGEFKYSDNQPGVDLSAIKEIREKVSSLEEQIKNALNNNDLIKRIENIEDILYLNNFAIHVSDRSNNKAFCLIDKQLNCPVKPSKPAIKEALLASSPVAIREIFGLIKEHRNNMVLNLSKCSQSESKKIRDEISHLVMPLETIVRIEEANKDSLYMHDIFANLAYTYKDLQKPSWDDALRFIEIAIKERDKIKSKKERMVYIDYEINRMLCNINLEKRGKERYDDIDKDFKAIWSSEEGQNRIMDVPPVLFPKLYEWMVECKIENMIDWLRRHPDKQDDWFNKSIPEQVKEKVKRKMK